MKNFSKIQFGRRNKVEIPLNISKSQFERRNNNEISTNPQHHNWTAEISANLPKHYLDAEIVLQY